MNESSRLYPASMREQSDAAIAALSADNDALEATGRALDAFINDDTNRSAAFENLRRKMQDFRAVADALIKANDSDIADHRRLIHLNNPVNRIDYSGLDSYVFYDPNDDVELMSLFPFVTRKKADLLAKELTAFYGTDTHVIAITSADNLAHQWDLMGSNGNPIDGVVLYFHGRPTGDGIGFIDNQGSPSGWGKPLTDVTQLSRKSMDTLIVLSCHQAKGDSSFTYQMANRMTLNYAIAKGS